MSRNGLLIGEVTRRTGASRKALRLYEAAGILTAPRRTESGYRLYGPDTLDLLAFVRQAQRLGFSLDEIREIVAIQRSGRVPCPHVRGLVERKRADLDRRLADLADMRKRLDAVLRGWSSRCGTALVCLHIEQPDAAAPAVLRGQARRTGNGKDGIAVPDVRALPRGHARRRRGADR